MRSVRIGISSLVALVAISTQFAPAEDSGLVERFTFASSPIEIRQPAKSGRFFDTMARRAGILGSEGQGFEAWVYPLLLFHDCRVRIAVNRLVSTGHRETSKASKTLQEVLASAARRAPAQHAATHCRRPTTATGRVPLEILGGL